MVSPASVRESAQHVYRGLAGLIIVDDGVDSGLPRRYGVDDIPLVLQDRVIGPDGSLREDRDIPIWGLMGNGILVNGTLGSVHQVTTSLVRFRFRVLNGSNARMYNLRFSDSRPFTVVGNDLGLLPTPVETAEASISAGERIEILVAFAPGQQVLLQSRSGDAGVDEGALDLLALRAAPSLADGGRPPSARLGPASRRPTRRRPGARFRLSGNSKINSREMELSRVDEVIPAGAVEIWEVDNIVYSHNFHIHDAPFTVLSVDGRAPGRTTRATRTPCSCPVTPSYGWRCRSATTSTRWRRTCTTATCSPMRTRG